MANATDSNSTHAQIAEIVSENRVVLFMKGNRHFPQCGFSAQVVNILDEFLPSYKTVNVLSDPALRDGIKSFSSWPTIPQLYVDGKFVGGCDIVREMRASGELATLLQSAGLAGAPSTGTGTEAAPKVTLSPAAVGAFKQALGGTDDHPRLHIPSNFEHELFIDEKQQDDILVEADGLVLLLDPATARRANGVHIDFVAGPGGEGGFKIENPNAPPRVQPLSVKAFKEMIERGDKFELFDVRTPEERAIASLKMARHLDDDGVDYLQGLPKDATIVFHCHHGMRSRAAAERFLSTGFTRVFNLEGGIDAWSRDIDPSVPRY
ncbi:Grx4 family monothiol glutaredoxin [Pendulispora rubella]